MRCSISSTDSSTFIWLDLRNIRLLYLSAIDTNDPGRVDKGEVLRVLQASGENYDLARETLKHVSVDASGKVEVEDWVEVCSIYCVHPTHLTTRSFMLKCAQAHKLG